MNERYSTKNDADSGQYYAQLEEILTDKIEGCFQMPQFNVKYFKSHKEKNVELEKQIEQVKKEKHEINILINSLIHLINHILSYNLYAIISKDKSLLTNALIFAIENNNIGLISLLLKTTKN